METGVTLATDMGLWGERWVLGVQEHRRDQRWVHGSRGLRTDHGGKRMHYRDSNLGAQKLVFKYGDGLFVER